MISLVGLNPDEIEYLKYLANKMRKSKIKFPHPSKEDVNIWVIDCSCDEPYYLCECTKERKFKLESGTYHTLGPKHRRVYLEAEDIYRWRPIDN